LNGSSVRGTAAALAKAAASKFEGLSATVKIRLALDAVLAVIGRQRHRGNRNKFSVTKTEIQ
jgi:hypothetical protein